MKFIALLLFITSICSFYRCDSARSTAIGFSENQVETSLERSITSARRTLSIQDYLRNGGALRDSMDNSAQLYQNEIRQTKQTLVNLGLVMAAVGAASTVTIALSKDDNTKVVVGTVAGVVVAGCGFVQALFQSRQEAVAYVNECNEAISELDVAEKSVDLQIAKYSYVVLRKKASRIKSVYPEFAQFGIMAFEY